jgi:hypothetical protein
VSDDLQKAGRESKQILTTRRATAGPVNGECVKQKTPISTALSKSFALETPVNNGVYPFK